MPVHTVRSQLTALFAAAVSAVNPRQLIQRVVRVKDRTLFLQEGKQMLTFPLLGRVLVIGAGKGAGFLAEGLESILDQSLAGGIIIVPSGQTAALRRMTLVNGEHPLPGPGSVHGAAQVAALLSQRQASDFICVCLTGGASSLLVSPASGISLAEKIAVNRLLLACGADIHEVNTVRKHLSQVKGGGLARWAFPNPLVSFLLSDVIGDDVSTIGSGPTAPDTGTFCDAWAILDKYGLRERVPQSVLTHFRKGIAGSIPETPKSGDPVFAQVHNIVVGSNRLALDAAAAAAQRSGFLPHVLPSALSGDTTEAAKSFCFTLRALLHACREPVCVLAGGETTVRVVGQGKGGRNQEFALTAACELQEEVGWALLSAGSDGIDGPTDAAGAFVDSCTIARARQKGLDPFFFLRNNDTYTFFSALDELFLPGPTGTNVMDIKIALAFPPDHPLRTWLAKARRNN